MAPAMPTEPRPTRLTAEGRLKAAITIARELAEARLIEASEVEESARDIAALEAGRFADGFEVAKRLEDRAGWDCNFAMAEVLDGYGHACGREIEAEERRWAERNDVQPPLPDGTRILFAPRDERGVIEGVSTSRAASFLVRVDGEADNTRRLVRFEDARPDPAADSPTAHCPLPTAAKEAR
jgi:hypothetical protein